jgi:flavin-dependent dehydrogenase
MDSRACEMLIVGAGPAGLSAARTAARLGSTTVVIERLAGPGDLAHPCSSVIVSAPGFVSLEQRDGGLYAAELDLFIPESLIVGHPARQRYTSPGGYEFDLPMDGAGGMPAVVIDKAGLLRSMAQQAVEAGAEIRYLTAATGLLYEGNSVVGVRTTRGEIRARLVLSAEGAARRLAEEAGLYAEPAALQREAFIVSQELDAPAVRAEHLGQIVTLGNRYTSAREAFGTVVLPAPGRASVYFTAFAAPGQRLTVQACWPYLDEYMLRDPRVSGLFTDARILSRAGQRVVIRDAPRQVVCNGFMGLGDAVTPGGRLGILPAIQSGRQAALVAAGAVDDGDVSAECLASYAPVFQSSVLRGLEAESKVMMGLTGMSNEEADRLCQTLQTLHLATPYFSNWRTIAWETVSWLMRQFPLGVHDWDVLRRTLQAAEPTVGPAAAQPAVLDEGNYELMSIPLAAVAPRQLGALPGTSRIGAVPLRVRILN